MPTDLPQERHSLSFGDVVTKVLGALLMILGIVMLVGGVWLIWLGGSWYYGLAGLGLIASGMLVWQERISGFFVYLATWVLTLIWAVWEVGFDWWAQVPRLVAPTVLLVLVALVIPVLKNRGPKMV